MLSRVLLVVFACTAEADFCGIADYQPKLSQGRIFGGFEARPHSWPWHVSMKYFGLNVCGGTLISDQWVVTAAHCLEYTSSSPSMWSVALGKHDLRKVEDGEVMANVVKIFQHPNYEPKLIHNDIALFKLERPIGISDKIKPVCLPDALVADGAPCYVAGWGATEGGDSLTVLNQALLPIINHQACNASFKNPRRITNDQLCAGHESAEQDTCVGDSGGALLCKSSGRYDIQGVTSYGSRNCSTPGLPGVYTKIVNFKQWMQDIINTE